eukprot:c13168_g1_i1 orf=260-1525(+)
MSLLVAKMWAAGVSYHICSSYLPVSSLNCSLLSGNIGIPVSTRVSFPLASETLCISTFVNIGLFGQRTFGIPQHLWTIAPQIEVVEKKKDFRLLCNASVKGEEIGTEQEASFDSKEAAKLRRAADWERALKIKETGALHMGKVDSCKTAGLLVCLGSIKGYLPFSQLSLSHFPKDGSKTVDEVRKALVGQFLSVKIIEANEQDRRLIFSEKQAVWLLSVQQIKEGDILEGRVSYVTGFGAFVDLRFPDGSYPISGLVHSSELSWEPVWDPRDVVQEGQVVRVRVTSMDLGRQRLGLSIKQLKDDPLLETLETLITKEETTDVGIFETQKECFGEPLPGLEEICDELLQEDGITNVALGRQVLEKRVVSQGLELWLSNADVEDGNFTLLARAGRQVQEVQLTASLDREGIKAVIQRVSGRVP